DAIDELGEHHLGGHRRAPPLAVRSVDEDVVDAARGLFPRLRKRIVAPVERHAVALPNRCETVGERGVVAVDGVLSAEEQNLAIVWGSVQVAQKDGRKRVLRKLVERARDSQRLLLTNEAMIEAP